MAIVLADKMMKAMGGRENWDATRYISWNFFDNRQLLWDKYTGDVRIKHLNEDLEVIVNINSLEGKVKRNSEELQQKDSVQKYLSQAQGAWINDSYWLVMPYKLKDSGVTLEYVGEEITQEGDSAYVLELTFEEVGNTPQNKYHVFVDKNTFLVSQWAYFSEADQAAPNFTMPWKDYKDFDGIMLSGNRGERALTDIQVLDEVPEHTFTSFDPVPFW